MATNVTEKDKTLQEIIDWCEQLEIDGLRLANALLMQRDTTAYGVVKGQIDAYGKTADHCRSMLGYSGSMLSCLTYEDTDNSDPSDQPQVGDYGVAVREAAKRHRLTLRWRPWRENCCGRAAHGTASTATIRQRTRRMHGISPA